MKVDVLKSKNQPSNWFEKITSECLVEYPIHLAELDESAIVADVGCNVGGFSKAFSNKFKNILAIDASSYNVEQYKINHKHEVWHKAVWDEDNQIVRLKKCMNGKNDDTCSGNFSVIDFFCEKTSTGWNGDEYEEVETVSLETIVNKLKNIDILKVDVEGAEYKFLYQKDLKKIKYIFCEVHNFLGQEKLNRLFEWISNTHDEIYSCGDGVLFHFIKVWKIKNNIL